MGAMNVELPSTSAICLLLLGGLGIIASLFALLGSSCPKNDRPPRGTNAKQITLIVLLGILVLAFAVRYRGITERGMTHVEAYVPGLPLPPGISTPPQRQTWAETLWFHFHEEPHPQAYYFTMLPWTKTFGTSLLTIRLPSLVFNLLSVLLLFFLVRRESHDWTALMAASLLAFHGHQIYWSQQARMYAMGSFLGLVSTYNLFTLLRGEQRRTTRFFYVLSTLGGLSTQIFFWPFLAAQMFLVACLRGQEKGKLRGLFTLQALVVTLGTPLWTHALYRARSAPLLGPSWDFTSHFFSLGFLFENDVFSLPTRNAPPGPATLAIILTLIGLGLALFARRKSKNFPCEEEVAEVPFKLRVFTAVMSALFIVGLAATARSRQPYLYASALLPFLTLILPWFQTQVAQIAGYLGSHWLRQSAGAPFVILSLVPFALLMGVGVVSPLLKSRGMITFVPYLVGAVAIGWSTLTQEPKKVLLLALLFAWPLSTSIQFYQETPEPNAHREIASRLKKALQDEDLIFVKGKDWTTTPSLYHLYEERHRLVGANWKEATKRLPQGRIWVLTYSDIPAPKALMLSLKDYRIQKTLTSRRCQARLFVIDR